MAILAHLGPLRLLWAAGQLGPFWPNPMRPKGAKGGSHPAPKPHLDPPEPKLATNPLDPKLAKDLLDTNLAINPVGPVFGHGPPSTNISAMASGNHQRPPDQLSQPSPQPMGNSFHSFIPSVLKVAGM
ncbi:hypothetical protein O181_105309, partial [Austropuccinia psidii MF-1]|nr:hypothetical protein [Austropuccinia psidii MF-1]